MTTTLQLSNGELVTPQEFAAVISAAINRGWIAKPPPTPIKRKIKRPRKKALDMPTDTEEERKAYRRAYMRMIRAGKL